LGAAGIDALLDKGRRKEGTWEAMKPGSWEKEVALRACFKRLRRNRGKLGSFEARKLGSFEARKLGKRGRFGS